ncbi:MAG: hypothetical protein HYR62_08260 [Actinobacteria bacterium]|nr:hypothetical protein [Actinomycetota bacterium]MBI3686260.1 hypothetical protein [Actinomycetota bacterium]
MSYAPADGQIIDTQDVLGRAPVVGNLIADCTAAAHGDYQTVIAQCLDLGIQGWQLGEDPLGWLIGAGLSWLVGVFQPLEDGLGLVTGNGDRIKRDAEQWHEVARQLKALSVDLTGSWERGVEDWHGDAADRANARTSRFLDGVHGVGAQIEALGSVLGASQLLMEVARGLVLSIIAEVVEKVVVTWIAAQAVAVATFGASEALAMDLTVIEVELAEVRVTAVVARCERALVSVESAFATMAERVLHGAVSEGIHDGTREALAEFARDGVREGVKSGYVAAVPAVVGGVRPGPGEPPDSGLIESELNPGQPLT